MDRKALIVVTSHDKLGDEDKKTGFHLAEVTHIYYPLMDAGFQVAFASPQGGEAPIDPGSIDLDDPLNARFLDNEGIADQIKHTIPMSEVNPSLYQIIHFAGGHGTMWDFPDNKDIQRVTSTIYENGGVVAAICHGPAALVNVKLSDGDYLVEGKQLCSFTDKEEKEIGKEDVVPFLLESKLKDRGAEFKGGDNWDDQVVVSERLVTGQNPQSATHLAHKILEVASLKV